MYHVCGAPAVLHQPNAKNRRTCRKNDFKVMDDLKQEGSTASRAVWSFTVTFAAGKQEMGGGEVI